MSDVTLTVNRRAYTVACEDGQEDHLRGLGRLVEERVGELVGSMGQVGDRRLLVMASLLFADEAKTSREALQDAQEKADALSAAKATEEEAADAMEDLAARIEALAGAIEKD